MATVYLSLGTNLGNREENLNKAVSQIEKRIGRISSLSAFYQTAPWGFESQNEFLNIALKVESTLSPVEILRTTQNIETDLGRTLKSNGNYSDRVIDIDILFYDKEIINTPDLVIPHPLLQLRDFVLTPMVEIAPDFSHPIFKKNMTELLSELKNTSNRGCSVEK